MSHPILTVLLFVAAMLVLLKVRDGINGYRCPQCLTSDPNDHSKDCSWR